MQDHARYMTEAIALAQQGQYSARPNPCVGCVLVQADQIVGRGAHMKAGEPHAEVLALADLQTKTGDLTAYVTLEPCVHHGRTGPCVEALIANGRIKTVVIANQDPNPLVSGKGIAALQAAGITVITDVLKMDAMNMNLGFFSRMQRQRPYVRAKIAMSIDGRMAMEDGESQWITSEAARRSGQHWRALSGAILTGIETVLYDDCRLTVRAFDIHEQPLRVILDPEGKLRDHPAAIVSAPGRVLIYTLPQAGSHNYDNVEYVPELTDDPVQNLKHILYALSENYAINDLLIEGGPTVLKHFFRAQLIDECLLFIAPKILGDRARSFAKCDLIHLKDHIPGAFKDFQTIGPDLFTRLCLSSYSQGARACEVLL